MSATLQMPKEIRSALYPPCNRLVATFPLAAVAAVLVLQYSLQAHSVHLQTGPRHKHKKGGLPFSGRRIARLTQVRASLRIPTVEQIYICKMQGGGRKTVPYTMTLSGNLPDESTYLPFSAGSRPTRLKKDGNERHSPWGGAYWL